MLFSLLHLCVSHKLLITWYWMNLGQTILCHRVCATPAKFDEIAFHWFVYLAHYLGKKKRIYFCCLHCKDLPQWANALLVHLGTGSQKWVWFWVPWVKNVGWLFWLFTTIVKELFLSIFTPVKYGYKLPVICRHPLSFTFAKTVHN